MAFVSIPFTTDAVILADEAIDRLQAIWGEDWEANDGDLEVIQISVLAPMAQEALEVAAEVPDAVFREFGTKLVGVPYQNPLPAVGTATFEALDDAGYDSVDQVLFVLDGQTFQTDTSVVIEAASTTVDVEFTALIAGVAGNGLIGDADVISALPWVLSISVNAITAGGVDSEDDIAYQNRLTERLQLGAITLVTGRDFEIFATQQEGIGRAVAIVGEEREVTVAVIGEEGESPVDSAIKTDLEELYDTYRQVNTVYDVIDPTINTIRVTLEVIVSPGWAPSDVKTRSEAALNTWLDPMNWGSQLDSRYDRWTNETKVRLNEAVRVASVEGVRYVVAASVLIGSEAPGPVVAPTAADLTLTGTVPITSPSPTNIVVTATPLAA